VFFRVLVLYSTLCPHPLCEMGTCSLWKAHYGMAGVVQGRAINGNTRFSFSISISAGVKEEIPDACSTVYKS
jgi:hypothetical protein